MTRLFGTRANCGQLSSGRWDVTQLFVAAVFEILVEAPALNLRERLIEILAREAAVIEPFAAAELRIIPRMKILEFRRHREPPQRQILFHVDVHGLLGAVERAQIRAHALWLKIVRNPPQRLERIRDDRPQSKLLGHCDLRRQEARGLTLAVQERFEPRAEPASV